MNDKSVRRDVSIDKMLHEYQKENDPPHTYDGIQYEATVGNIPATQFVRFLRGCTNTELNELSLMIYDEKDRRFKERHNL